MVGTLLYHAFGILKWLIMIRVVLSWLIPEGKRFWLADLIRGIVDPLLAPLSGLLPLVMGMDITPLVAFLVLTGLQQILARVR